MTAEPRSGGAAVDLARLDAALPGLRACVLSNNDAPRVQAFYDTNPDYFVAVSGQPAQPGDALEDLTSLPPQAWGWRAHWYLAWVDDHDRLAAVADVTADLLAEGVWHVGLFIVETRRHGSGDAQRLYTALESWARSNGAHWMRLGVVQGHARAEAFWARCGYRDLRTRSMDFGVLERVVRVMVKPLAGGSVDGYLALVERDRPGAT